MSDFGKFFDAKLQKKQQEQEAARAERERKRSDELKLAEALAEPLNRILPAVLETAKTQLAEKGIEFAENRDVSMSLRSEFKVFKAYRLEKRRADRGRDVSSTFGFRVYNQGSIEGFIEELNNRSEFELRRLFLRKPEELSAEDIGGVIEAAIESLVMSSRP